VSQEDILVPLVKRLCVAHCWRDARHVKEPFTRAKLAEHIAGTHRYGLAPIKPGESTTRVGLLDLDSHDGAAPWEEMLSLADDLAFTLRQFNLEPALFRSSGGKGIHIITLWDAPQDAHSVRALMRSALHACGCSAGTAGVAKHEVEVFPKQSKVDADAYGSMFALPLCGNTKSEVLK